MKSRAGIHFLLLLLLFCAHRTEAAQSCTSPANGGCRNGSKCTLNSKGLIYCKGCPKDKFTGFRCEIPVSKKQSCTSPANGGCRNGSKCTLNSKGLIYCKGCPKDKFTGFRCEKPVRTKQSCTSPPNGGCRNKSTCRLNSKGLVYCKNCPAGYSGFRCEIAPSSTDDQLPSFCGVNDPLRNGKGVTCPSGSYCSIQVSSGGNSGYQCTKNTDYESACYPACSAGQLCVNGYFCSAGAGCSAPCPTGQVCTYDSTTFEYACKAGPACSPACGSGGSCTVVNGASQCVAARAPERTPAPTPAPGACIPCGRKVVKGQLFEFASESSPDTTCCPSATQGCYTMTKGSLQTVCKPKHKCSAAAGEVACGSNTDRTPGSYVDNVCCKKGQTCVITGNLTGQTTFCG